MPRAQQATQTRQDSLGPVSTSVWVGLPQKVMDLRDLQAATEEWHLVAPDMQGAPAGGKQVRLLPGKCVVSAPRGPQCARGPVTSGRHHSHSELRALSRQAPRWPTTSLGNKSP